MRLTITYGLALIAGVLALTNLERPTRIMFDPATDGPIRIEEKAVHAVAPISSGSTSACLTSMSMDGGKSGMAVYTPCSTVTVSGSGGGTATFSGVSPTGVPFKKTVEGVR